MTDDKLRGAVERVADHSIVGGYCVWCRTEGSDCKCEMGTLRAALADSATADKGTWQPVAKNCPECGGALWPLVENAYVDRTRRKCRRCDRIYQVETITATADAPPSTNPDTISSSLIVGEPTDEMVAVFDEVQELCARGGSLYQRVKDLRAVLAAAQPDTAPKEG